ncbi:MAG: hypothetical protein Q4E09_00865 [Eubacteriales bacterium]|nr:hypothetical protein [Eubacteriales bacterium]
MDQPRKQTSPQNKERARQAAATPGVRAVKLETEKKPVAHKETEPQIRQAKTKATTIWSKTETSMGTQEKAKTLPAFSKEFKKALMVLVIATLIALLAFLPAFRLQNIESNNLYFTHLEDLLVDSGLRKGEHFLLAYEGSFNGLLTGRYRKAEQRLEAANAQIRQVEISYHFPSILRFEVEERIPVAFLDVDDLYVTLDRFGVACASYKEIPQGLPAIRGQSVIKMRLGEPIVTNADDDLKACIAVMSAIVEADFESQSEMTLLTQVKEIRSSGYQRIVLKLAPKADAGVLTVSVTSESNLKQDFLWLKRVLDSGVLEGKLPGSLDIFGSQLVFRPDSPTKNQDEIELPPYEVVTQAEGAAEEESWDSTDEDEEAWE